MLISNTRLDLTVLLCAPPIHGDPTKLCFPRIYLLTIKFFPDPTALSMQSHAKHVDTRLTSRQDRHCSERNTRLSD
jgi:hypothetical protein